MKNRPALPLLVLALAAAPSVVACGSATSKVTDAGGDAMGSAGKGGTSGTGGIMGSAGQGGIPGTAGIMGSAGQGGIPGTAGIMGSGGNGSVAGTGGGMNSGGNGGRGGNPGTGGAGGQGGSGGGGKGGAGGAGCVYDGVTHATGTSFPSTDGCNTCTCTAGGQITCTERACPNPDGGASVCMLDAAYQYGQTGGLVAYSDQTTLTPPRGYKRARTMSGASAPQTSCAPALPACETANVVDVADIMRDIADADVQAALAAAVPSFYGYDMRPSDGTAFSFTRGDGHGFLMSDINCPLGPGTCKAILPGLMRLVADLRALDQQQLKDESCMDLR